MGGRSRPGRVHWLGELSYSGTKPTGLWPLEKKSDNDSSDKKFSDWLGEAGSLCRCAGDQVGGMCHVVLAVSRWEL